MIFYVESGSALTFLYDIERTTLNDKYCYISSTEYLLIPIHRVETNEATYKIQVDFFRCDNSANRTLSILNREYKTTIRFDANTPSAVIVPSVNGKHWYFSNSDD